MKRTNLFKVALMALPLLLSACHVGQYTAETKAPKAEKNVAAADSSAPAGQKQGAAGGGAAGAQQGAAADVAQEAVVKTYTKADQNSFMYKVADNAQHKRFITSKLRFSVEVGPQKLSLTGNLRMKRDDVIRIQLMAFGFVEAGRLEFTPDYVLVMDRINKLYLKASYRQIDFLRNSGLNFYSLQALSWNELFIPGKVKVTNDGLKQYDVDLGGDDVIISMSKEKMNYSWLASNTDATLKMVNILYRDQLHGNTQLNWDYTNFKTLAQKPFPHTQTVTLTTPKQQVKVGMNFNYVEHAEEWELRTEVSDKYREVSVDEILRRFMAL